MILKKSLLFLVTLLLVACGEYQEPSQKTTIEPEQNNNVTVTLSGKITYDFVPFKSGGRAGLDYNNISKKPVRGAMVEIIDRTGKIVKKTKTDNLGHYAVTVTSKQVKVRVLAKLYQSKSSAKASWDFEVKDNTNRNALYVMDGKMANLGDKSTQTRNLNASSGWNGTRYGSTRVAAPFAILDVIYQGVQKVVTAQSDAVFSPLNVFWSKKNVGASGDRSLGQIITSHYDGTALYILGAENSDTDEYDAGIIAHEWGHYYESQFSRADNIGGSHGVDEMLDMRVAFGEGFGNAFSSIIRDDPLYIDSIDTRQSSSFVVNLETANGATHKGWYSEGSIGRILYDIYDKHQDTGDTLSLGFSKLHNLFTGAEKNTPAFTSIFTFITALKAENPEYVSEIDAITLSEDIQAINDIYGTGRINRASQNANPLYSSLFVGNSVELVTNTSALGASASAENKLGAYNFVKFSIATAGSYTLSVRTVDGSSLDPDFSLYTGTSNLPIAQTEEPGTSDSISQELSAGKYRMAIIIYDGADVSRVSGRFRITLKKN